MLTYCPLTWETSRKSSQTPINLLYRRYYHYVGKQNVKPSDRNYMYARVDTTNSNLFSSSWATYSPGACILLSYG